jgi:hypothetical protein
MQRHDVASASGLSWRQINPADQETGQMPLEITSSGTGFLGCAVGIYPLFSMKLRLPGGVVRQGS